MSCEMAKRAIDFFMPLGLKRLRFCGGDPLQNMETLNFILEYLPKQVGLRITCNGIGLTESILDLWELDGRVELVISVDGERRSHDACRRGAGGVDAYGWFENLSMRLARFPDIEVNTVVSPETVDFLVVNVAYLMKKGFSRINLLPAYYHTWQTDRIDKLNEQFRLLAALVDESGRRGLPVDILNLSRYEPQALYRRELLVDTDGEIYDNDMICASALVNERAGCSLGNIDSLEDPDQLKAIPRPDWPRIVNRCWDDEVIRSTRLVDDALSRFVESLKGR